MKRKLLALVLILCLMATLVTVVAEENEPVTIRYAWWGSQLRNDQTMEVVNLFMETYPWITVECEFVGWADYWDNLSTQVAANELPDVVQHDHRYLETYVNKGLLYQLDEFSGNGIDLSNVSDAILSSGVVNGGLYGIPMGMNCFCVIYDADTFAEYGIEEPAYDWTYDDYLNICAQFAEHGIYGMHMSNFEDHVLYYLRTKGATLYNQVGKGLGYDDDSYLAELFQMRLDQVQLGYMSPPDVAKQASGYEDNLVCRRQAAMVTYWSNAAAMVQNGSGSDRTIKVAPMYGPNSDLGTYVKPSMYLAMSQNTEHPAEAAMLIDFIINNLDANDIMMGERGVPVSSVVREHIASSLSATSQSIFELIDYMTDGHSSPINNPDPEGASEVVQLLQELEEMVLYEQITPAEAAATFREQATQILESK